MARDAERIQRTIDTLQAHELDALVCSLPANVLMVSGYFPVVGTSLAIATAGGKLALIVPEDEKELAREAEADVLLTFEAGSLDVIRSGVQSVREPLSQCLETLKLKRGQLGHDGGSAFQAAPYAALHTYGSDLGRLLGEVAPASGPRRAEAMLRDLRALKSRREVDLIGRACAVAGQAFAQGRQALEAGISEAEAALRFRGPLCAAAPQLLDQTRADGFTYCMSGPNAYHAYAAYQRSRGRRLAKQDFVLVHCNSYVGGYWTDITRTYFLGEPDTRAWEIFDAILAAREAALQAIRPGAKAAEVDAAARGVLAQRGFAKQFKHPAGHGAGFAAIDHTARPVLHPKSDELLQEAMVFNLEPGIYIEGYCGVRHCDMIAVTPQGAQLLTPFQTSLADLIVA